MRMKTLTAAALAAGALGIASTADAQGLELCYEMTDLGGGMFGYKFTLSTDAGWAPGMGWKWFIFGDEPGTGSGGTGISPIKDFSMDPGQFPLGPWTNLTSTGGGHNGPTFGHVLDDWIPASGSETLTWEGESVGRVAPGEMLFSTLAGAVGGAIAANLNIATVGCEGGCPCACNVDTSTGPDVCDIFDFLGFQDAFVSGETCACDIDTSTGPNTCDIFDFLAFQDEFVGGCP